MWLWAIAVTLAREFSARQRARSSPFLMSQTRTSSLAATMAWPAPVALPAVRDGDDHTIFELGETTTPKDLEGSNFLGKLEARTEL